MDQRGNDSNSGKPVTGKLQVIIEDMSKEELILQIKKHLVLLHKLKSKCDDYSGKCHGLEKRYEDIAQSKNEQQEKVDSLSAENDSLKKTLLTMSEDVQCMKMKEKTMAAGFQSVLEEVAQMRDEKEKLTNQIILLTKAREEAVASLKNVTTNLKHEMEDERKRHSGEIASLMSQNGNLLDANHALEAQLNNSKAELDSLLNEKHNSEALREDLEIARNAADKIQQEYSENLKELGVAQIQLADLQEQIKKYSVAKCDVEVDCHLNIHDVSDDFREEEMNELRNNVLNLTEELELSNAGRYNLQLKERELMSEMNVISEQCTKFKELLRIIADALEDDTFLSMDNCEARNHINSLLTNRNNATETPTTFTEYETRVKNMIAKLEEYGCEPRFDSTRSFDFAELMANLEEGITTTLCSRITELNEAHRIKCESLNDAMQDLLENYEDKTAHCSRLENSIGVLNERLSSLESYCFPCCSTAITQTDEPLHDTDEINRLLQVLQEENASLLERESRAAQISEQFRIENENLVEERKKYTEMYNELKTVTITTSYEDKHVQSESSGQDCEQCVASAYREKKLEDEVRLLDSILVKCQEKLVIFKLLSLKVKEETDNSEARIVELLERVAALTDEKSQLQTILAQFEHDSLVHGDNLKTLQGDCKLLQDNLEEQKQQYISCHEKFLKNSSEYAAMQLQMAALKEENENLSRRLVMAESEKEMKHQNVISLEIEDYERHVKDLNERLKDQDQEIKSLKVELQIRVDKEGELQREISDLENQKTQTSERADKLKVLLIKCKRELAESVKVSKNQQTLHEELLSKYEIMQREAESYKVQTSDMTSELQAVQEKARIAAESNSRTAARLENKISSLQEKIASIQQEYEVCQAEYNSYKVRVHSVLKQQKTNQSPSPDGSRLDDASEKERLENLVQHLQLKMQEIMSKLDEANAEREVNADLHERLLQRHNKLVQQLETSELTWNEKLDQMCREKDNALKESQKLVRLLQSQIDSLNASYMEQVNQAKIGQDALLDIRHQLEMSKVENAKLLQERSCVQRDEEVLNVSNMERQEGEGSEMTVDSDLHHLMSSPQSTFVPLEQLIDPDRIPDDGISNSSTSVADINKLENQLGHATKKIDHLAEVLHESEATNARLSEQARVLKEEIRRLERNQEREQHAANMEYLKNVIVKFFSLQAGSEREQLVSVLKTMLRFSRQEEEMMILAAKGSPVVQSHSSSSWSSYLPAWSNLV